VTIGSYARMARKFVAWRFGEGDVCLRDVRATDAYALRPFLRYALFRGEVTAGLAWSVLAVAGWTSTPQIHGPFQPNTHSAQLTVAAVGHRWDDAIAPYCRFWHEWGYEPARSSG
jgi:hypothetical protein